MRFRIKEVTTVDGKGTVAHWYYVQSKPWWFPFFTQYEQYPTAYPNEYLAKKRLEEILDLRLRKNKKHRNSKIVFETTD